MAKSIRISDELYELAATRARLMHRSLAQQLEHWAALGSALEDSGDTNAVLQASIAHLHEVDRQRVRNGTLAPRDLHMIPADVARRASVDFPDTGFADFEA
jgi:hypothetical protein